MRRWWRALSFTHCRRPSPSGGGVPSGFMAMYVGPERRRFIVPVRYLNLPVFASLLERAKEEYGYKAGGGGLALPCDAAFFQWIVDMLGQDERRFNGLGLDEIFSDFHHLLDAMVVVPTTTSSSKPLSCFFGLRRRRASSMNYSGYYPLVKGY